MKLKKIETISRYQEIIERYGRKGCVSNDYIQREAELFIQKDRLFEFVGDSNAFLLLRKDGFWRVYYYLNDYAEPLILDKGEALETEVLFRDSVGEPEEEVLYLERSGFKRHLIRDQYVGMYGELNHAGINTDICVRHAQTIDDVYRAVELFNNSFDKYSGDYVSSNECGELLFKGSILIAKKTGDEDNNILGALHQSIVNNVAWISHLAVERSARGNHVGQTLLDAFVEGNMAKDKSRYMFWVQHENEVALRMYQKKGFRYMGKSSLSMIKP